MPQDLVECCAPYRRLAIAGTAKNTGKTTALNALIEGFAGRGERVGISSIGRDGEAIDLLTDRPKPRIRPPVGALVATSAESAALSGARLRRLEDTPYRTALGQVAIYEVQARGHVEVAGPVKTRDAAALLARLEALGCDRALLDGAADRRAFLGAGVEGFVLATGLALDVDPEGALAGTRSVLARLQLPEPPDVLKDGLGGLGGRSGLLLEGGGSLPWREETLLASGAAGAAALPPEAVGLYVHGAFADTLGEALLTHRGVPLALVVPRGTHLLLSAPLHARLAARGHVFYGLAPLRAVALALNPTAPTGEQAEPRGFLAAFRAAGLGLPVFDVRLEAPQ